MADFDFVRELLALRGDLFAFAYKLTGDKDEAEDLLQTTLLKALEQREKYTLNTNFKGWIFVIMRNQFLNDCRVKRYHPCMSSLSECAACREVPDNTDLGKVDTLYDTAKLSEVLHRFPEEQYLPFKLFLSGFRYHEIAVRLGISIGTVKSRIFYCRKKLQELLREFVS